MRKEILKIARDLRNGTITTETARTRLLDLFGINKEQKI